MKNIQFEWDLFKERINVEKHGVSFEDALQTFLDVDRLIIKDNKNSEHEPRFYCIGQIDDSILTVRFTYRSGKIRIFGAGKWRKWRKYYEKEKNKIHR